MNQFNLTDKEWLKILEVLITGKIPKGSKRIVKKLLKRFLLMKEDFIKRGIYNDRPS